MFFYVFYPCAKQGVFVRSEYVFRTQNYALARLHCFFRQKNNGMPIFATSKRTVLLLIMQKIKPFILGTLLFFGGQLAQAQSIQPLLEQLTPAQKLQTLEYIRSLGVGIDQQILCAFEQLAQQNQAKATQFLEAIQPQKNGKPIRTEVSWSRDTIHFGTLEAGTTYIDSIILFNTGTRPYTIYNIQTACNCTVVEAPTQPLMPGELAIVRIEFNSSAKRGKVSTGIVIQDNSIPNARSIIHVKGTVTAPSKAKKRPWE